MTGRLALDPLLALPWIVALSVLAAAAVAVYVWRGAPARLMRLLALGGLMLVLLNPVWVREERAPLNDVVALIVDASQSMSLENRATEATAQADRLERMLKAMPGVEVRRRDAVGSPAGTQLYSAIEQTLADVPPERIGASIVITDGQIVDAPRDPKDARAVGPLHAVIVGDPKAEDRRLVVTAAPRYAIVGEPSEIDVLVEDPGRSGTAQITLTLNGENPRTVQAPLNQPAKIAIELDRRGPAVLELATPVRPGELTGLNNRAAVTMSGVRDRLRVLLVTGEPHQGARVWRDLLKSDPAVDLVHFTILRPPEKQDGTPVEELSLIAFPTQELFVEKLARFDLIIFDRYRRRGILPMAYFENIARYVRNGGALLVAAGPPDAGEDSLWRTPLADILPAAPTGGILEQPFRPAITADGVRHPVTASLTAQAPGWGRWYRLVEADVARGRVVMAGAGGRPLLVLDRVGDGRIAQVMSDQMWLWARGHDGGGPHAELLRRLAHWLMKEPELEEERLTAESRGADIRITRRTFGPAPQSARIVQPDGGVVTTPFAIEQAGLYAATLPAPQVGLYRVSQGGLTALVAQGPLNPAEYANVRATPDILAPAVAASRGGLVAAGRDPPPDLRRVQNRSAAAGNGWFGVRANKAYAVTRSQTTPLLPAVLAALVLLAITMAAWRREGR